MRVKSTWDDHQRMYGFSKGRDGRSYVPLKGKTVEKWMQKDTGWIQGTWEVQAE